MAKLKVVLDTNIIVSAVLRGGEPGKILELWRKGKFDILVSSEIFEEYYSVLIRDKFSLPLSLVNVILEEIKRKSIWIKPYSIIKKIKEDPTDNKFLECAVDGQAEYIVSGDPHLLNLKKFNGIEILRAAEFAKLLAAS